MGRQQACGKARLPPLTAFRWNQDCQLHRNFLATAVGLRIRFIFKPGFGRAYFFARSLDAERAHRSRPADCASFD
jgi:hypothetical protein